MEADTCSSFIMRPILPNRTGCQTEFKFPQSGRPAKPTTARGQPTRSRIAAARNMWSTMAVDSARGIVFAPSADANDPCPA